MVWKNQNPFSSWNGLSIDRSIPEIESGNEIKRSWLRSGVTTASAESEIGESSPVDHFRTPKMARVEAALFVSDTSLSSRKMVQLATLAEPREAVEIIEKLNESYEAMGSAIRIERVATGYRMLTIPKVVTWLDKLHHRQSDLKLSASAMETLTIIAYRQPVTRADIEVVRGVQVSEVLKQLLEKGLIRVAGEEDSLGRPYLYDTTRKFLETFGLRTLQDLPNASELREPASKSFKSKTQSEVENTQTDEMEVSDEEVNEETDPQQDQAA